MVKEKKGRKGKIILLNELSFINRIGLLVKKLKKRKKQLLKWVFTIQIYGKHNLISWIYHGNIVGWDNNNNNQIFLSN